MGEALYAIQIVMHAKRRAAERETRLAALVCAGVLFEVLSSKAGFRLLSCFNDFLAAMLRFARSADEGSAVRVEATRALGKVLIAGKTATEAQAKEAVKVLRGNLVNRSPLLVLVMVGALEALVFYTPFLGPEHAFDAEGFVAGLVPLLSTSVLVPPLALALLRAGSTSTAGRSVSASRVSSSAPGSGPNSGQATLSWALQWLSQAFIKSSASREVCSGIVDAYAALFDELGPDVVEAQYSVILSHVLGALASATQIPSSTAIDSRTKSPHVGLTHAIGTPGNLPTQVGSQPKVVGLAGAFDARAEADILALRNMLARWLAGSLPAEVRAVVSDERATMAQTLMPWRTGSNAQVSGSGEVAILVALQEWRMLVEDLGESARALDVFESDDEEELWVVPLER
ncbi:hypothetical protein IWW39_001763 [Coemansia spiralis]|uniref:Uncharacterized protein n=1 Tax=Coemansia spiralis TaxID=417178 RepID=A0A9W8GPA1_9FUNG|nr:hypothetical protein IWW39_001763 [Coemansia spiralis]